MQHIIISDTHSPQCTEKSFSYAKKLVDKHPEIDSIVINGDLLGSFSMTGSVLHKGTQISREKLNDYLKAGSPNFFEKFMQSGQITEKMVLSYVAERYQWCYDVIEKFSKIKHTIFNMGNHESPLHFLVLQELQFLTGCGNEVLQNVDKGILVKIFEEFERQLYILEGQGNFTYIRSKYILENGVLILGISGESHGTVGNNPESIVQEKKTRQLLLSASKELDNVHTLVIYNHTQGIYNRENGTFSPASESVKEFIGKLPGNVKRKIWVQSHNHWSYTQVINLDDFYYVMNNTGLHDGIFNIIDFSTLGLSVYDADPNTEKIIKVKENNVFSNVRSEEDLISRYYDDANYILARKTLKQITKVSDDSAINISSKQDEISNSVIPKINEREKIVQDVALVNSNVNIAKIKEKIFG